MQITVIGAVANSLPPNEVILLALVISKGYISYANLCKIIALWPNWMGQAGCRNVSCRL